MFVPPLWNKWKEQKSRDTQSHSLPHSSFGLDFGLGKSVYFGFKAPWKGLASSELLSYFQSPAPFRYPNLSGTIILCIQGHSSTFHSGWALARVTLPPWLTWQGLGHPTAKLRALVFPSSLIIFLLAGGDWAESELLCFNNPIWMQARSCFARNQAWSCSLKSF